MKRRLRIGISTCPNDTFVFHGLLSGAVEAEGLELEFELADVQALNEGLAAGRFDVAKASFAAAFALAGDYVVLPVGAALGFGVGPVVIAGRGARATPLRVLCPGVATTATLLWRLFHPEPVLLRQVVFSQILPALARGEADLGVCIHEGRFTYREHGLTLSEDLGLRWERESGSPLPLGGLLARKALGSEVTERLVRAIRASLLHGRAHRAEAQVTMQAWAAELSPEVLWKHVELYVNAETLRLSPQGRRALDLLARRALELDPELRTALEVAPDTAEVSP